MAEEEALADLTPCKLCREPIPAGARLCRYCHSHQDWRRYLGVSSTVLALLVALLSVMSTALPLILSSLSSQDSRISLSNPVVREGTLYLIATNTGNRPGAVQGGEIVSRFVQISALTVSSAPDAFVASGAKQIALKAYFQLSSTDAMRLVEELAGFPDRPGSPAPAHASIRIQESDGGMRTIDVPLSPRHLIMLLGAHMLMCEHLRPPASDEQGCLRHIPIPTGDNVQTNMATGVATGDENSSGQAQH